MENKEQNIAKCLEETELHIQEVRKNLLMFISELVRRSQVHDASKLEEPELSVFAEFTPELAKTEYGSKEYEELLAKVKPAIDHHYANNSHHPEFYKNGINDMDLLDIVEMLADWKAATKRNKNGNIRHSLEVNAKRFGISIQLATILENTIRKYFND